MKFFGGDRSAIAAGPSPATENRIYACLVMTTAIDKGKEKEDAERPKSHG